MTLSRWIVLSTILRGGLLVYSDWHDRHFDVSYTDVDYHVYGDAAKHVWTGGSPYERITYRYSPLIAWFLIPNVFLTPLWGKELFCLFDLLVVCLIISWHRMRSRTHSDIAVVAWLLNPFTFAISTRGSCDSITVFGLLLQILALSKQKHFVSGLLWGINIHWRLFPVIYAPVILASLLSDVQLQHVYNFLSKRAIGYRET